MMQECLQQHSPKKMIASEIAEWIMHNYPEPCNDKRRRSQAQKHPLDTDKALKQQIVAEIGSSRERIENQIPEIRSYEERPRTYVYIKNDDQVSYKQENSDDPNNIISEQDSYPKLAEFLFAEFHIYSQRIDEKTSKNTFGKRGNIWLHPDIVGIEDLSDDWKTEIKDCSKAYGVNKTKISSFEVKKNVTSSNVRECFFQTVSNSSWADYGWLVAQNIETKALKELRILSNLHGIGFIKLNIEQPNESNILIPAREKPALDWHSINRIAQQNKDFQKFMIILRQFYQTGDFPKTHALWLYHEPT